MREIPITAVNSQEIVVTLENVRHVLTLKEARGVMVVTIVADGVVLVTGSRVLAGEMLVPYRYRETAGNFLLQTQGEALPDWRLFGASQQLFYLTAAEMETIRAD